MRPDYSGSQAQQSTNHQVFKLHELALDMSARGAVWKSRSEDLNVNVIVLPSGEEIPQHVNSEVDVLIVPLSGSGCLTIEGEQQMLKAGDVVLITKGTRRGLRATDGQFAYLTCHRRRDGLWPEVRSSTSNIGATARQTEAVPGRDE